MPRLLRADATLRLEASGALADNASAAGPAAFAGAPGKRTRAGFGEFPEDVVHERPFSVVCAAAPRVVWRSWQWPL